MADVTPSRPAGPELDAQVARLIFGLDVLGIVPCHSWQDGTGFLPCDCLEHCAEIPTEQHGVYVRSSGDCERRHSMVEPDLDRLVLGHAWTCLEVVPGYSVDLAAAMQILDGWNGDWNIRRQNGHFKVELFQPSMQWSAWGETLPLAICRAALAACS